MDKEIVEYIEDPKMISFVEWPENILYPQSKYNVVIKLKALDPTKREVELTWN
jgi:tRNA A37 threonylcarbamoyladenosine biosynthesis protein TsaE